MAGTFDVALLAAGGAQTKLFHFLLDRRHSTQMLHTQLLTRVLELVNAAFHFFKV